MSLIARTGPQEYECKEGILDSLTDKLKQRGIGKAILVHGTISWEKAQGYLAGLKDSGIELELVAFHGECTYEEVDRLVEKLQETRADAIIGVGGGKIMDAVKYAAAKVAHVPSILIPTLASNCAPWTPLSVMYTSEGVCTGFDIHSKQVALLLVEPELLLDAPVEYFVAGIGDTLAKWYESDVILSRPENQINALLQASRAAALICRDNIVAHGAQAVKDAQSHSLTPEFIQLSETIIAISGLVGGLGDGYARSTIAHAVHDTMTAFPETHNFLHGAKVAYGILVQLALEEKWAEIDQLTVFYDSLDLPKSLADVDLGHLSEQEIAAFATGISMNGILLKADYAATKGKIERAIIALDEYVTAKV